MRLSVSVRAIGSALAAAALVAPVLAQVDPSGNAPPADPEVTPFDPFLGMDDNGRIERPPLPADLTYPDRWRYTPPGRIAPGNIFERFLVSSFFSPVIFRDTDVGTGGGVAITDIDFRNQDYQEFANLLLTYTSEGQQAYNLNWRRWLHHRKLPGGGIAREERSSLFGKVGYSRTLTRRYFGTGSRTSEANETSYTEELGEFGLGLRLSLPEPGSDVIFTGGVRYEQHNLGTGRVSDIPNTEDVFATEIEDGDGVGQAWVDVGLAYDSRDSLHQPYRGVHAGITASTAALQTGGGLEGDIGGRVTWDAQAIVPLPPLFHTGGIGGEENPPTDVLAVNVFVTDTFGELPFYSLPSIGGSHTLRGFIRNRFTGQSVASGSIEYRLGILARGFDISDKVRIERLNLGLFYDFGTVADELDQLDDGRFRDSIGIGLRFSFAREASFRLDYGFSDEGGNFSIRYGHAF